ncbi:hypothetical protein [Paenarthrobacter sp. NCHU4564]
MGKLLDLAGSLFRLVGVVQQDPEPAHEPRGTIALQFAVWEQQL